jgi:molybdopterin-guanine dinucleotide biosynthesis protein A
VNNDRKQQTGVKKSTPLPKTKPADGQPTVLPRLPLTAVILAGGRSLRMGVDKTRVRLAGESLVARVVNLSGQICDQVIVVTNRPDQLPQEEFVHPVQILQDETAYQGPLGALSTALSATGRLPKLVQVLGVRPRIDGVQ